MASSSIGMLELPYSNLPFSLSGSDLTVHAMGSKADFLHDVLLISGVRSEQEVMRGEETQMIGLFLSGTEKYPGKGIYILPGTHSKHIAVEEARMTGFESYMTGELFHVLGKYSILKDAVSETRSSALADPANRDAFNRGVLESARHPVLRSLFSVRSNQLFDRMSKEQNGFYLSGLLIGAELAGLQHKSGRIHLCIGNPIHCLYEWGILQLGLADRTEIVPPERMDQAIAAAHVHLFKAYKHGKTRLLQ
jgi:2-dehydro-3-deoxygalactonokinase